MRQRALYQAASLLDKMGHDEAATSLYRQFASEFPDAPAAPKARIKLGLPEPSPQPPPHQENATAVTPSEPAPTVTTDSGCASIDVNTSGRSCPDCNSGMERRKASNGPNAGKLFWVCAAWPQCRKVLPMEV